MPLITRHRATANTTPERTASWYFYASGFNAHGQLDESSDDDLYEFRRLPPSSHPDLVLLEPQIVFLGWSETIFASPEFIRDADGAIDRDGSYVLLRFGGASNASSSNQLRCAHPAKELYGGFGDHSGLLGVLTRDGEAIFMRPHDRSSTFVPQLEKLSGGDSPCLGQLAIAGNGRVAVTFVQASSARLCHISEFPSFASFTSWYLRPNDESHYPAQHHMIPGQAKQLISNATTFTCLMQTGEVYTWGDARHRSLGRNTIGEGATEAKMAGRLEALGGISIKKVCGGGWINAALSDDGAVYLWGVQTPGKAEVIKSLDGIGEAEVSLVQIPGRDGEPLDIYDVAVGSGHIVLLVEPGRVFVCGDNENGQLGLGSGTKFSAEWEEARLPPDTQCLEVFAGPKYSLVKSRRFVNDGRW